MRHAARRVGVGLLWVMSGCLGRQAPPALTPEQIDELCNGARDGRLPSQFFAPEPVNAVPHPTPVPAPSGEPLLPAKSGQRLLAIDPQSSEYRAHVLGVCIPADGQLVSFVHVCVNESGTVTRVEILQGSKPILDSQLPGVIGSWKFHPYAPDGTPTAFCYNMAYRVASSHASP